MPKNPDKARDKVIPVRCSSAELALIVEAADAAGINRSEFIREAAKTKASRVLKTAQRLLVEAIVVD